MTSRIAVAGFRAIGGLPTFIHPPIGYSASLESQQLTLTEKQFADLCLTLDRWIDGAKREQSGRGRKGRYRFGVAFFPMAP